MKTNMVPYMDPSIHICACTCMRDIYVSHICVHICHFFHGRCLLTNMTRSTKSSHVYTRLINPILRSNNRVQLILDIFHANIQLLLVKFEAILFLYLCFQTDPFERKISLKDHERKEKWEILSEKNVILA